MKRVAITRAAPDAERTAERVRALGAEPVIASLLKIEARPFDANVNGVQALLFTSANGARAFAAASADRTRPVLTVGDFSAEVAGNAGFLNVQSANGDVAALLALAATLDPKSGALVHISGADVAGDLTGELNAKGFAAERRIAYAARAVTNLPLAFSGALDLVLFHSARAAEIFVQFGAPGAERMQAACLSPAVAAAAAKAPWAGIMVAPTPREDVLLRTALAS